VNQKGNKKKKGGIGMDALKEKHKEYTEEQMKDARKFLDQLKKLPKEGLEAGRLLTIGFMNGLDAAQLASRK
jgi:hypothetical protein